LKEGALVFGEPKTKGLAALIKHARVADDDITWQHTMICEGER
jgi:hypothetical protein